VGVAGLVAPRLGKREGAGALVVAAPDAAGVVFAPNPKFDKKLGAAVETGVAPVLAAAGVDPGVAEDTDAGAADFVKPNPPPVLAVGAVPGAAPGVDAVGFGILKLRPFPAVLALPAPEVAPDWNRLGAGAPEDAGALLPPRLNPPVTGVVDAGAPDVGAKLNPAGLLTGVAAGVVLPILNMEGFGAADVPCVPDVAPRFIPPNGFAVAVLFASAEASLFPPMLNRLPAGLAAGVELEAPIPPNGFGVEFPEAAPGFEKIDEPAPGWLLWLNMLVPGGGPAGVVDGRKDVLLAAGVDAVVTRVS
jgi:hypothetical protein